MSSRSLNDLIKKFSEIAIKIIGHLRRAMLVLFSVWLMGVSDITAAAATAEQLLADINRLPANERQARLEKGAKQEGSVVWYAAMNRNELSELKAAFEAE